MKPSRARPLLLALPLLLTLTACATNPVTGQNDVMLFSTADEIAMGEQHYRTM